MSATFGELDERGRAVCPRCGEYRDVDDLGRRIYRCQGACKRHTDLGAGAREFRIHADAQRRHDRQVQRARTERVRMEREYEEWMDRYATRPRSQMLRVLRPSPRTRAAWMSVRRAKRLDSFQRRGQEFLYALRVDLDDVPRGESGPRRLIRRKGRVSVANGLWRTGAPTLHLVDRFHLLGRYRRSLTEGHTITIATHTFRNRQHVRISLDEMRETFIHEVQHWLDSTNEIDDEHHGRRWHKRLAELGRIFPAGQK